MKLRDTIAIEVMKTTLAQTEVETWDEGDLDKDEEVTEFEESIARGAYRMADAMLRVREEIL